MQLHTVCFLGRGMCQMLRSSTISEIWWASSCGWWTNPNIPFEMAWSIEALKQQDTNHLFDCRISWKSSIRIYRQKNINQKSTPGRLEGFVGPTKNFCTQNLGSGPLLSRQGVWASNMDTKHRHDASSAWNWAGLFCIIHCKRKVMLRQVLEQEVSMEIPKKW